MAAKSPMVVKEVALRHQPPESNKPDVVLHHVMRAFAPTSAFVLPLGAARVSEITDNRRNERLKGEVGAIIARLEK